MAQAGYTPISLYYSTTASAVPTAANLVPGELAININDGKLYYENSSGVVTLLAAASGASGDVVGPASATDNAITRFDGTTGKLIQNSSALVDDAGNVLAGAGLVGTPAFSTTGDTNTGIFFPAADTIAFAEGGVEAMRLDSSGNLGLGVTPSAWSSLKAVQITGGSFAGFAGASTNNQVHILNNAYYAAGGWTYTASDSAQRYTTVAGQHQWWNAPSGTAGNTITFTQAMTLDASGNLGIGTSSPAYRLDVNAPASNNGVIALRAGVNLASYVSIAGNNNTPLSGSFDLIQDQTLAYVYQRANAPMVFGTNNTERMRITSAGDVGIGTTGPNSKLDVSNLGTNTSVAMRLTSNDSGGNSVRTVFTQNADGSFTTNVNQGNNGSTTAMIFQQAGTERMRIDSSGNVGIGLSTPSASLEIVKSGSVSGALVSNTRGSAFGAGWASGGQDVLAFAIRSTGATLNGIGGLAYASQILAHSSYANTLEMYTIGTIPVIFGTNSAERMRIDSAGRVAIGPIASAGYTVGTLMVGDTTNSGASAAIGLFGKRTTEDQISSDINFYNNSTTSIAYIYALRGSSDTAAGKLTFGTGGSERLRIDSSGNALFAKAVRATITTDNDLSFDMNAASNFKCTPTAGGALTFTNITSGQTGNIILVNNSNYAITAAATTKVSSTCLATISATGTYWLSYYSDGTNVYVANTGALA